MMRFDKTRAYTETSKCLIKPISYDSDYVYMRPLHVYMRFHFGAKFHFGVR